MRLLTFIAVFTFFSCGQNSTNEKEAAPDRDAVKTTNDTTKSTQQTIPVDSITAPQESPLEIGLNEQLKTKVGNQWRVVNDSYANWPKDEFDYFIAPVRKTDPHYPYIAKGDFNADGKTDHAALVINDSKTIYQIALFLGRDSIVFWKEDIDLSAISTFPKTELEGIDGKKAKMKSEGINVEYFEKSSFVIFWNGAAFKRIWTGD